MASDDDAAAQLILLYQAANSNLYWSSCAIALLFYDYLLTFRRELRFVWGRKFSAATALFVLNRYLIVLLYLVDLVTQFPIIPETCPGVGRFITVLEVMPYIIWATFSALRGYALSRRNVIIGITIFVLSLVPAGVNAYFFSTFTFMNLDPPNNCTALSDITPELSKTLTIVSRACLMAADVLIIIVTWISTYRLGRASRDLHIGASFGVQLLRDGTIYFVVLVAMNIVHMVLNTIQPNNFVQQASYVTILENPLTSILISRFILNLRAIDDHSAYGGLRVGPTHTTSGGGGGGGDTLYDLSLTPGGRPFAGGVRFASVSVGSVTDVLGAPLDFGGFGVGDEGEEGEGEEDSEAHGMEALAGFGDSDCAPWGMVDDASGERGEKEEGRGGGLSVVVDVAHAGGGSSSTSAELTSARASSSGAGEHC